MEGNFLSRYENKITEWERLIKKDPSNKSTYEDEMHEYMLQCLPFMNEYMETGEKKEEVVNSTFKCTIKKGLQKKEIFEKYLNDVEGVIVTKQAESALDRCKRCNSDRVFFEHSVSDNVCNDCGAASHVLMGELTYKEEQENCEKNINYSYKRENHFNEWISQFQAQETTTIPPEVIQQLRTEFKKMKIKKLVEITQAKVRSLLKKLRLNKYYEHVPYITNSLNGLQPPKMSVNLEERLRIMFKEIQEPFDNNCPQDRKNFLSYSYVLYKFCELLGEDEFLHCFPLLKSKEKLYQQDVIWKMICHDLKWEFIPTI
jgi:hypothetical protein